MNSHVVVSRAGRGEPSKALKRAAPHRRTNLWSYVGAASSPRRRCAIYQVTNAAFFKEVLEGPWQAEEAALEEIAGLRREALVKEARDGVASIIAVTIKSRNLKGTVDKAIKRAVKKVDEWW